MNESASLAGFAGCKVFAGGKGIKMQETMQERVGMGIAGWDRTKKKVPSMTNLFLVIRISLILN